MNLPIVWASGGGVQSAAIAALICAGELPKPDVAVIADTEREKSSTWEYMEGVIVPNLAKVGVTLHRIPKSAYATVDLWGLKEEEDGSHKILMPMFTDISGTPGRMPLFCSKEWKARVCARFVKERFGFKKWVTWLGMSLDETSRLRVRGEDGPNHYPLCFDNPGRPMRRAGCVQFVTEVMGWPAPPRSACYQCPNQTDEEWLEMKENRPGDFAKAVVLDYEIRESDPNAYLHGSCVPLDLVDFAALVAGKQSGHPSLFGCESGYCFV